MEKLSQQVEYVIHRGIMNEILLKKAIDFAINNNWEEAHAIVQDGNDFYSCWIHAVLHKLEGDNGNSRYWYVKAGKKFDSSDGIAELKAIKLEIEHGQ